MKKIAGNRKKKGKSLNIFSINKISAMSMEDNSSQPNKASEDGIIKRVARKLGQAAKSPKKMVLHIIARGEQWIIKREGALKAYRVCKTKDEAIENAKDLLQKGSADSIIVHFQDGTVARKI